MRAIWHQDTLAINHLYCLENYSSKFSFKSPRGQWVNVELCLFQRWIYLMTYPCPTSLLLAVKCSPAQGAAEYVNSTPLPGNDPSILVWVLTSTIRDTADSIPRPQIGLNHSKPFILRNKHTIHAVLWFGATPFYPYPSGLLHWHT